MLSKVEFKNNQCIVNEKHFFTLIPGTVFDIENLIEKLKEIGIDNADERVAIINFCREKIEITEEIEPENQALKFLSSKELMNTPKEKGFIIQHLIQKNTVNQLLSPPANFKSITALTIAVCVANGRDFLGFKTKKFPVAYLDKENNRQLLRDRLNNIFTGLNLRRKVFPLFFLLKEGMLDNPEFVKKLSDYIEQNKIKLVIFDTLVRFNSGEENSARDMNKIYQAFVELQKTTQTAILFLHHTNRQGEFRGSSDLMGQVDTMFTIHRKNTSGQFTIVNTKNRMGEINDINAEMVFSDDSITMERSEEASEEEEKQRYDKFQIARAIVLDFAKNECPTLTHWFDRADLLMVLKAWNAEQDKKNTISQRLLDNVLKHLIKIKILRKGDKRGQYFFNNAENEHINKWIGVIGLGKSINPEPLQQEKTEDTV